MTEDTFDTTPRCVQCGVGASQGYIVTYMATVFDPDLHADERPAPRAKVYCLDHEPENLPDFLRAERYDGFSEFYACMVGIPGDEA